MRSTNFGWIALGLVCLFATVVAGVMMSIAWDHNPQLVFHEEGIIQWNAWLAVGLSWFVAIAGVPLLIALVAVGLSMFRRSR